MDNATLTRYLEDSSRYTVVPFRPKSDPENAWTIPYVTGHKYKLHWHYGLDFMNMTMELSPYWQPGDNNINLVFNYSDARQAVVFKAGSQVIPNATLLVVPDQF